MARRRKISPSKRNKKNYSNKKKTTIKKLMIDVGRLSTFKFNLRAILSGVEGGDAIFANVLSKSMNVGISDTLEYIEAEVEKGTIQEDKSKEVTDLMNRYTKYR